MKKSDWVPCLRETLDELAEEWDRADREEWDRADREARAESDHTIYLTLQVRVFGRPDDDYAAAQRLLKDIHLLRPNVTMRITDGLQSLPREVTEPDPWAKVGGG